MPTLATNKRALFDYHVLERFEAGVVLTGPEVKSVKSGRCSLVGSFVNIRGGELWLLNANVPAYPMAGSQPHEPDRSRKLLLRRREIDSLVGTVSAQGLTVLPLSVYTKGGLVKITLGICRGKKQYDKRALIKKRESDRSLRRLMSRKSR
ncbi:MAG: SsrA-binding protein SmpB [Patescibacteria group bacterium]